MLRRILPVIAITLIQVPLVTCLITAGSQNTDPEAGENIPQLEEQADYEAQLQLLAECTPQFLLGIGGPDYAVTDLDHNGRLEVFAADNGGDVSYTAFMLYEVNETLDGIKLLFDNTVYDETKLTPDICLYEQIDTYFADDTYFYVVYDRVIKDEAISRMDLEILSLKDGELTIEKKGTSSPAASGAYEYYDAEGNAMDEAAFDCIPADLFPDAAPQQTSVKWIPEYDLRNGNAEELLTESWEAFTLCDMSENQEEDKEYSL